MPVVKHGQGSALTIRALFSAYSVLADSTALFSDSASGSTTDSGSWTRTPLNLHRNDLVGKRENRC